ncbi:MAG: hypothetical protein JW751_12730 [Polyangiaceae bacterium]|nr:hypothetical protein [Polyangiaceae bacterium]
MKRDADITDADRNRDVRSLFRMLAAVAVFGAAIVGGTALLADARAVVGAATGSLLGLANLWVIGKIVEALVGRGGRTLFWGLVGAVKMVLLGGAVYLVVFAGFADILPLVLGYGALPVGIIAAQLSASTPPDGRT